MLTRRALAFASRNPVATRTALQRSIVTPIGARCVHVEATKDSVQTAIKSDSVLVFSKTHCPHCARVKALFQELKIEHEVVELDKRQDGAAIQELLLELTKQRTVPNVFIKGKHIGGCDATMELHASNKLMALIKK